MACCGDTSCHTVRTLGPVEGLNGQELWPPAHSCVGVTLEADLPALAEPSAETTAPADTPGQAHVAP